MKKQVVEILLVEDEIIYSKMILFQLSKIQLLDCNVSVNHVASITEMRELGEFLVPDIILLDLGMPESSGIETFDTVRAHFHESAIIILSGTDDDELAAKLVRNGAQDYLVKTDVEPRILRKTIEHTLERMVFHQTSKELSTGLLNTLAGQLGYLKESIDLLPEENKMPINDALNDIERTIVQFLNAAKK